MFREREVMLLASDTRPKQRFPVEPYLGNRGHLPCFQIS